MKSLIFSGIIFFMFFSVNSQVTKTDVLKDLEKNQPAEQFIVTTATLKSASRLFKDKDDLTSVIMVIPKDSVVKVLGADSTFLNVEFEGNAGFIYAIHAEISKTAVVKKPAVTEPSGVQEESYGQQARPVQKPKISRYAYLEKKYGPSMAARLYAGKIWRGMDTQMVKDSWGSPRKIDRIISGNIVKEDWLYGNTWLHFQNSTLIEWGPVR